MVNLLKFLVPKDYFSWMDIFMKGFCLNSPETRILRSIYNILSPPFFLIILSVPLICEPLFIILSDDSAERKLLSIGIFSLHFCCIVRILTWLRNGNQIEKIINVIKRPTFEFGIFDVNDVDIAKGKITDLRNCEKYRSPISAYQEEIKHKTSLQCSLGYLSFFAYLNINFVSSYTMNYYEDTYEKFNPYLNKTSVYRDFVYPMWLPFDYSVSDGQYFLTFMYQPIGYYVLVGGFLTLDWLFLNIITHLRSQVTIIAFALTQVDCNIPGKRSFKSDKIQEMRIVKCIQELDVILGLAEKLDSLITVAVFSTFSSSLLILCCLSYLATVLSASFQISLYASIFGVTLIENFVVCWFCQEFTSEFFIVLRNVYDLDWLRYSTSLRRKLVILMTRLQKPPTFTLLRWSNIDMLLFIKVVRLASSFYTLLSNINGK